MLPATSCESAVSNPLRYSRSSSSSSFVAHGKATLNIPVALQKPSLLRRCSRQCQKFTRDSEVATHH